MSPAENTPPPRYRRLFSQGGRLEGGLMRGGCAWENAAGEQTFLTGMPTATK